MWILVTIGVIVAIIYYVVVNYWWVLLIILGVFVLLVILAVVAARNQGKSGTNTFESGPRPTKKVVTSSGWFEETPKKEHNGRCNGDCANCPPHYGYRYGRWYYGRDHIHGCQFGGNRGGGQYD